MNTATRNQQIDGAVQIAGAPIARDGEVLTTAALTLLKMLHRRFNAQRLELLKARETRQARLDAGETPDFIPSTAGIREDTWHVGPIPKDLQDRRVEITGPVERKMIINALNAPVEAFMADFEDSCAPTWNNAIQGQINLRDAIDRTISYTDPVSHKVYRLQQRTATLIVRPRGWHLDEKHVYVDDEPVSASLFDFALYFANNHQALARTGSGPYFYLPKLESHLEARLWNDVFVAAQEACGVARGTIKATVLIETILAAFEMDEILFELKEHIVGLNCGRWDYIFSFIKKFRNRSDMVLPDRAQVTMDKHFLKSYVDLLIKTCHRRGAYAMGGMAAQIPIRDNPKANQLALAKVLADKTREVVAGHDGTWIAHPGLAEIAHAAFDDSRAPNQLKVTRDAVVVTAADLLRIPEGTITREGAQHNVRVGIQYLAAWLSGSGCVPLYNLMEDAATAEICRAQLWQWLKHEARLDSGEVFTLALFRSLLSEAMQDIRSANASDRPAAAKYDLAAQLFERLVIAPNFAEFLTLPAYELLP
jgi:malate synthase